MPDGDYSVPIGVARIAREGSDLTVIAYGLMLHYCLQAANELAQDGVSAEVLDLRTISPLDKETIVNSVQKTGKCLVVSEDTIAAARASGRPIAVDSQGDLRRFQLVERHAVLHPAR